MSLSHKSRTALFRGLTSLIDDEDAVEEMLSSFPSRELDEPVTKDFHRAETALLRAEFHHDMSELRTEMHAGFADLRVEMHRNSQRLILTLAGLMVSMTGVVVAALAVGG